VPEDLPLQLLFEDEHLAVLNKAAGMVVHPAPGHWSGTLVNALRFHLEVKVGDPERPGIVHRLDRDTSGVMVVARSERAREGLIAQWKRHAIEREYVAIAQGEPPEQLRIETLHGRDPKHRKRFTSRVTSGKPAITELRVLSRLSGASLVSCTLQTGRTHQIRMHLSERGYPLLADALYGRPSKDPRIARAAEAIGRQALHARLLGFVHPVSEQALRFICDPPADFERALAVLREG
jgi:23S rRNA pseudouridine1911/1915/1917 synthase